jgi:TorA maturation chaperone TorD
MQTPHKPIALELRGASTALDVELARAEIYGLLARLLYAAPDADLLGALQVAVTEAPDPGGFLQEPWQDLVAAARAASVAQLQDEYAALFGGVGRPEVLLYASHYLSGFLNEKPLVELRRDLAELGLQRDDAMAETEDHAAYVCEVMRFLIAGDDAAISNLARQHQFFARHVQTWLPACCDAMAAHPRAQFCAALARFAHAFVRVEQQAFEMN